MSEQVIDPVRIANGTFALYRTPSGGLHLSLQVEGEEDPRHMEIPPFLLKTMGKGVLAKMLGGSDG